MTVLILADVRNLSNWKVFGGPRPSKKILHDRVITKSLCQKLATFLIRKGLQDYYSFSPGEYRLDKKDSGAPYLAPLKPRGKMPYVSISHSGHYVGVALNRSEPVGLDIENKMLPRQIDKLSKRFSSKEQKVIDQEGKTGFYRIWTGREALGKSLEGGLEIALSLDVFAWPEKLESWSLIKVSSHKSNLSDCLFSLFFARHGDIFFSLALREKKGDVHLKKVVL